MSPCGRTLCCAFVLHFALFFRLSSSDISSDYCTEEQALEYVRSEAYDQSSLKKDLQSALMHGWWTASEELIAQGRSAGISLTSVVYQAKSKINNKMKQMTRLLKAKTVSKIHPAFEWAQSPDMVLLNVKLAHKLDTPATLDCVASDKTVSFLKNKLSFKAECARTNKAFLLELDLWGDIDPEGSTWAFGSVGRVSINLKKDKNVVWRRLLKSATKKPGNMHTWWAVKAKYDSELAELGKNPPPTKSESDDSNNTKTESNSPSNSTETTNENYGPGLEDANATSNGDMPPDSGAAAPGDTDAPKKKQKKSKKKKKKKKKKKSKTDGSGKKEKMELPNFENPPNPIKPPKIDL